MTTFKRSFHSSCICAASKGDIQLDESFLLLGVKKSCNQKEARDAFIHLAKQYHPDSGKSTADPDKFSQIELAYRNIAAHLSKDSLSENGEDTNDEDLNLKEFDIRHTAPQHRLVDDLREDTWKVECVNCYYVTYQRMLLGHVEVFGCIHLCIEV